MDFRPPDAQPAHAVHADAVVVRMAPLLREGGEAGVTALVECTPPGLAGALTSSPR